MISFGLAVLVGSYDDDDDQHIKQNLLSSSSAHHDPIFLVGREETVNFSEVKLAQQAIFRWNFKEKI